MIIFEIIYSDNLDECKITKCKNVSNLLEINKRTRTPILFEQTFKTRMLSK